MCWGSRDCKHGGHYGFFVGLPVQRLSLLLCEPKRIRCPIPEGTGHSEAACGYGLFYGKDQFEGRPAEFEVEYQLRFQYASSAGLLPPHRDTKMFFDENFVVFNTSGTPLGFRGSLFFCGCHFTKGSVVHGAMWGTNDDARRTG